MNELALFAGAGGGILGGHLLGWRTVCAVEWEPYPASVLCARQNDEILPPFPIWDDVQTFDGRPWAGIVDVISGGFPCQDISAAGKGAGIEGKRSGMWREMARIIHEVRPEYVFVENSPMLTSRGLGTVLGDLAALGFDAEWGVLSAAEVGAKHKRERIWIVAKMADSNLSQQQREGQSVGIQVEFASTWNVSSMVPNPASIRQSKPRKHERSVNSTQSKNRQANYVESIGRPEQWAVEPNVGRVADGVAARVDRLKAIGNGQVPLCAAVAWTLLKERLIA